MRPAALIVLLLACACARATPGRDADTAAVYDAYLDRVDTHDLQRVILQDLAVPVSVQFVSDWRNGAPDDEVSREFSPEVREALQDLVARGQTPRPHAPHVRITTSDVRMSADSVRAMLEATRRGSLHRLPDRATIVQLSAVGFSRDGSVAAIYEMQVCGCLCGGASVAILRRHPVGWLLAERVMSVVY